MLGSSGILALWILAASPTAATSDCPNEIVTRSSIRQTTYRDETAETGQETSALPGRLPPDPAYDGRDSLLAQKDEGIPGLPPPPEQVPVPPKSETKPAERHGAKTLLPPNTEAKTPEGFGEATCGDAESEPCEVVHGRPHRQCSFFNWLDGVDFDTWLDQGATINTLSPRDRTNGPVTFNNRSNDYQLNQTYFRLKRDVNTQCDLWDVGGRVDLLYGTDSVYTEARGLETTDAFGPKWNAQQYGLALPQVYAEFFAPWGNGIDVKFGHFYSGFGYESVAAPENFFYSHSYMFQYGEPKTYTGFIGESRLGNFTITAGMTRGWDNWEDNNNDLAFTGGIKWESCNRQTSVALNINAGREQDDPSTNIRALYSLIIQQKLGDLWQYVIQYDYAREPGAGVDGSIASWYGVNQYLYREINECWKASMRFEWFRDENGSRVPGAARTGDYYELTGGVNWMPNTYVVVRPEIRWDFAGTPDLLPYGDGTRSNQLLLDCDVIVRF
jgi:hypothetical protein